VIENKICEGTDRLNAALQSGMSSLRDVVASARTFGWWINKAVTLLYLVNWPSPPTYRVKTQDLKRCDTHH
jgi:hypothetical protein